MTRHRKGRRQWRVQEDCDSGDFGGYFFFSFFGGECPGNASTQIQKVVLKGNKPLFFHNNN